MRVIGINIDKCIKCIECVEICPLDLFFKPPTKVGEKRQVIFEDPHGNCSECGLCVEVCQITDAIIVNDK